MKKNYTKIFIFTLLTFSSILSYAQTTFGFDNLTASGSSSTNIFQMTETVSPYTVLVDALNGSDGVLISTQSLGNNFGTSGNVMRSNPANRVDFTFNEAVDVISIVALNSEASIGNFTFAPTGGTGTPKQVTIGAQESATVAFTWQGATGFSVTSSLGVINFFFDTLVIDANTLSTKNFNLNTVSVYPNPTKNNINIKTNSIVQNVELYDILGKKVKSTKSSTISLENFSKGIYIMKVTTNKGVVTKKVTKI